MAILDRLLETAVALAAAPLFAPDHVFRLARRGMMPLTAGSVASEDAAFAVAAAESGMAEAALSEVALDRAGSDEVRDFARRMVAEHGSTNTELMALALGKRIVLPAGPDADARTARANLATMPVDGVDAVYVERMVADHERTVEVFSRQANEGHDPDLTDFARRILPMLEDHLRHARTLAHPAVPKARRARRNGESPS